VRPVLQRLAATALLVGAVLIGGRLLGVFGDGPVPVTVEYALGDPPVARALDVRFQRRGAEELLATFATRLVGPVVRHETRLPPGEVTLAITLEDQGGALARVVRTIRAERGAVVRLELAREAP
jgi:hypothetical protein